MIRLKYRNINVGLEYWIDILYVWIYIMNDEYKEIMSVIVSVV